LWKVLDWCQLLRPRVLCIVEKYNGFFTLHFYFALFNFAMSKSETLFFFIVKPLLSFFSNGFPSSVIPTRNKNVVVQGSPTNGASLNVATDTNHEKCVSKDLSRNNSVVMQGSPMSFIECRTRQKSGKKTF